MSEREDFDLPVRAAQTIRHKEEAASELAIKPKALSHLKSDAAYTKIAPIAWPSNVLARMEAKFFRDMSCPHIT